MQGLEYEEMARVLGCELGAKIRARICANPSFGARLRWVISLPQTRVAIAASLLVMMTVLGVRQMAPPPLPRAVAPAVVTRPQATLAVESVREVQADQAPAPVAKCEGSCRAWGRRRWRCRSARDQWLRASQSIPLNTEPNRRKSIPIPVPISISKKRSPNKAVEATEYRRFTADVRQKEK
jgi:hypothetical protein